MTPLNWDELLDGQKRRLDPSALGTSLPTLRARAYYEADKRGVFVRTSKVPNTKYLEIWAYKPYAQVEPLPHGAVMLPAASALPAPTLDPSPEPDDQSAECVCGGYPRCQPWCLVAGGDGVEPGV